MNRTLSNTNEGSSYVMKVKARVASDRSSYTELFSDPTVSIPVVDRTAPVIMTSAVYTIAATSAQGVTMTFPATAHDAVDGIVSVTCNPPSGSIFSVGFTYYQSLIGVALALNFSVYEIRNGYLLT